MVSATRETATQRHWTCGRRLRERRHALGLTQAELVARLGGEPAITNRSISTWENGRGLDFGWLPELAVALDCSVTYLLGMTDDPRRWEPAADMAAAASRSATASGKIEPALTDRAPTDPAATEPAATEPAATEPARIEPASCAHHHNWVLGPGLIPADDGGAARSRAADPR